VRVHGCNPTNCPSKWLDLGRFGELRVWPLKSTCWGRWLNRRFADSLLHDGPIITRRRSGGFLGWLDGLSFKNRWF